MADKQIKVDIKQAFYDLATEIEKECGDWERLPETDEDRALKNRIINAIKKLEEKNVSYEE